MMEGFAVQRGSADRTAPRVAADAAGLGEPLSACPQRRSSTRRLTQPRPDAGQRSVSGRADLLAMTSQHTRGGVVTGTQHLLRRVGQVPRVLRLSLGGVVIGTQHLLRQLSHVQRIKWPVN